MTSNGKYLILKRSNTVKTMRGFWAGISGIIEGNESPLYRAKREIFEETGIPEEKINLIKTSPEFRIESPQYENHEWIVHPFLFQVQEPKIKLNWENQEYKWINSSELSQHQTVPSLDKVLASLL